jgi:hypothetical protein
VAETHNSLTTKCYILLSVFKTATGFVCDRPVVRFPRPLELCTTDNNTEWRTSSCRSLYPGSCTILSARKSHTSDTLGAVHALCQIPTEGHFQHLLSAVHKIPGAKSPGRQNFVRWRIMLWVLALCLASRILGCLLDFWKIRAHLFIVCMHCDLHCNLHGHSPSYSGRLCARRGLRPWVLNIHVVNRVCLFNKMVYSVLTQLSYSSFLATCFGFYKIIFRPVLTIRRYIQCVHTLWDPLVFTSNHNNHGNFYYKKCKFKIYNRIYFIINNRQT